MFDNIGTALVQAVGFFFVFGFFVYQLLSEDKEPKNTVLKSPKKIKNEYINQNDESKKKGLFGKKRASANDEQKPKIKGLFGRKKEPVEVIEKTKKKGWFN